jgi:hypothetical protein
LKKETTRMRAIPALTLLAASLGSLALAGSALSATAPARSSRPPAVRAVVHPALELRERLESILEAGIDGRPARVLPAALHAESWWKAHAKELAYIPGGDQLVARMVEQARARHTVLAARNAWELSERSFPPGSNSLDDALMRLDLVGMAAWLRAHGSDVSWPEGTQSALDMIVSRLNARHGTTLAHRFQAAASAALATPVTVAGDARPATRLLDLVDVVEKALHS